MATSGERPGFYRQLFEEISDAIFVYDPATGDVVDANPAATELTGYATEDLTGSPVTQFSAGTPAEVERNAAEIVDRSTEADQQFEWLVERADGEIRTTEVSLHRTTIDGADRVFAVLRDVTERERERAKLEESRKRLSLLTERSPDVFWMFSADWEECLFVNEAYETVWGRPADALREDPSDFLAGVHPDDRETVRAAIEDLSDGSRIDIEIRVNEAEDFQRWAWVEAIPVFEGETPSRHVGFGRDITDQKRLQSRLREQNEQLSALTDNVPVILFELDADGVFVQSRGRGLDAIERTPDEVLGESVFEVYDNDAIHEACRRALAGESVRRTVDLAGVVFDAWYEPTVDESGAVDGVIGVAVDVSERDQLQRELRANQEALTALHTRASRTDLSMDERIERLLDIGRERLDLPDGYLTRIGEDTQNIVAAVSTHEELQPGSSAPIEETYCRKTIAGEGLLGVRDATAEGWEGDPAYERYGFNCYLGGKLIVDDELYGTVCFGSPEARDREFSDSERAFVELLVQWLAYELERDRREAQLESRTQELRSVLDASPLAIVQFDENAVVQQWNPAAEEMFGVSARDAIGATVPILPESLDADFEALLDQVLDGEEQTNVETVRQRADGMELDVALNIAPITGEGGKPTGAVAVLNDITAQKRRQRQLDALREATQRLVETHTEEEVGSIAVETAKDALGYPVCAMWLYDETEELLQPLAETEEAVDLVGPTPTIERGEGLFWTALDTGQTQYFEDLAEREGRLNPDTELRSELVTPVGDHGIFTVSAPVPDAFDEADRQVVETLAGALDAALESVEVEQLLRDRERELQRKNDRLEEFTQVVAHDIRGPLTAASGFFEIARETQDEAHFERVASAHARMERLIEDLLTLASQGKSIADPEPIDLAAIARQAWPYSQEEETTLEIEEGLPDLSGDASRLEEVFSNLFRNAVEHAGPDVTVRVGPLAAEAGFYVEDDGPGIPPEERSQVFEFGHTSSADGTGLGLAIAEEVVHAHGWTISVADGTDSGARFEVRTGHRK